MSVTFDVSPSVALGKQLPTIDFRETLTFTLRGNIDAIWKPARPMVKHSADHALLAAVHDAFYLHYPLTLTPDAVWLTLARGFALHVNQNAEALRDRFVRHAGNVKLVVERRDFLPGRDNPWGEVFSAFSDQIATHVGKLRDFIVCNFSTTGIVERAASELMVMDTFQRYFEYLLMIGCGIPRVTLEGTVEDWKSIRTRAALFAEFGLEDWSRALDPVLEQFLVAAAGNPDVKFWQSMFRYRSGSFGSAMNGWILTLFPYLKDFETNGLCPNSFFVDWQERLENDEQNDAAKRRSDGLSRWDKNVAMNEIPPCLTSVPLKVVWGERECELRLVGGLLGVSQCPETLALRPEAGWVVMDNEPPILPGIPSHIDDTGRVVYSEGEQRKRWTRVRH